MVPIIMFSLGRLQDPEPIAAEVLLPGHDHYNHVPIVKGGDFLDVGFRPGEQMAVMKALGMRVRGVEPSRYAASVAQQRDLNVFQGTLAEAAFPPSRSTASGFLMSWSIYTSQSQSWWNVIGLSSPVGIW